MGRKQKRMRDLMPYQKSSTAFSMKEKLGQCFMPAAFINDSEAEIQKLEAQIAELNIGSICFFHSRASAATNFEGKKKVLHNEQSYERLLHLIDRYQNAAKHPLLIAIDAEWGLAMRIENTPQYPYALTLGAMQNREDLVFEVGKRIGADCRKAGIHWNLAPCVDINLNPENPVIGYRSFGGNQEQVIRYAKAYIEGMNTAGILNSIKHFPGHGDTAVDSHLGLPKIEKNRETLFEQELYPFIKMMEHNVDSIMVGHLAVPSLSDGKAVSASLSKTIVTNFLRGQLGYDGLVISDALNMHSVSKLFSEKGDVEQAAFQAGNDVLCFADHVAPGIEKILKKCSESRIEQSFQRIWKLKEKAFSNTHDTLADLDFSELMTVLAASSITMVKGDIQIFEEFRQQGASLTIIGNSLDVFSQKLPDHKTDEPYTILGINPRQVKPKGNFGFLDDELHRIQHIIDQKKTILYVFGNPFVLDLLNWEKAEGVVMAYQNFEEFQNIAAAHFLGNIGAKGKLPVTLKSAI